MRSRSFRSLGPAGFHKVAYTEWGDPANPRVLVCVHGLSRNGRDFDELASALSDLYRVVCPDVVGRGESDYLPVKEHYDYKTYCADMAALVAATGAEEVDWVGTSMGGLIGMMLAALPHAPIRRMVLNDIGPVVAVEGLRRIAGYVGRDPRFPDFETAYAAIRGIATGFGPMSEQQWRRFVEVQLRREADGTYRLNYDPGIAWSLAQAPDADIDLWQLWDAIRAPVFVLRGALSDLLRPETVAEMRRRGPACEAIEIDGVGHTPALVDAPQIEAVRRFLTVA
ncbi:MAG: alpha/beta fold hydrolase [Alphaproteobacteria bacterium]